MTQNEKAAFLAGLKRGYSFSEKSLLGDMSESVIDDAWDEYRKEIEVKAPHGRVFIHGEWVPASKEFSKTIENIEIAICRECRKLGKPCKLHNG